MNRAALADRLDRRLHITWKHVLVGAALLMPWAMAVTVGVAVLAGDVRREHDVNVSQQVTLDARAQAVTDLRVVQNDVAHLRQDVGWLRRSVARIERKLFGYNGETEEGVP